MKKSSMNLSHFLIPFGTAFILPSLIIFLLEVFVGDISASKSLSNIIQKQFADGHNLFLIALFGSIPFFILIAILFCASFAINTNRLNYLLWGGLIGILTIMLWGHISIWYPLYGPGGMSSTAVIGFIFIPFYCIPTMIIGTIVGWIAGWLISRRKQKTVEREDYMLKAVRKASEADAL